MDFQTPQSFKIGYRYGLLLLIGGLIIVAINLVMIFTGDSYFPKLLLAGMSLTLFAPIFFVFPGGSVDQRPEVKGMGKALIKNAPIIHKVIWIVWGIVSLGLAFYALICFDPDFYK